MITHITCGIHGRLGNQMFQYASLMGIARNLGYEFGINYNIRPSFKYEFVDYLDLPIAFKGLTAKNTSMLMPSIAENTNQFDPRFFQIHDNVNLIGNFETEKYFLHIKDEIRNEFSFHEDILQQAYEFLRTLPLLNNICIHVRRGDFEKLKWKHTFLDYENYYGKALSYFAGNEFNIILFSDEIDKAKMLFKHHENVYACEKNHILSMAIMSLCKYHIIANSTFSWWGAWLNAAPEKVVIAPKNWRGDGLKHLSWSDTYCEGWIIV